MKVFYTFFQGNNNEGRPLLALNLVPNVEFFKKTIAQTRFH